MLAHKAIIQDPAPANDRGRCGDIEVSFSQEPFLGAEKDFSVAVRLDPERSVLNKEMLIQLASLLIVEAAKLDSSSDIPITDGAVHEIPAHLSTMITVKASLETVMENGVPRLFRVAHSDFGFHKQTFLDWAIKMLTIYATIEKITNKESK